MTVILLVNRGTLMRPCGRTRGRRWREQITGRFEITKDASPDLRPKDCTK